MTTPSPLAPAGHSAEFPEFSKQLSEPYTILRLDLRPLSIGRYRRLAFHRVAFVAQGEAKATLGDLLLGVIICSRTCEEFDELANKPHLLEKLIQKWFRKVSPLSWLACPSRLPKIGKYWYRFIRDTKHEKMWRKKRCFDFIESSRIFHRYIRESQEMPRIYSKASSDKTSHAHWVDSVELVLRKELNWTSKEINEAPLSKALADWVSWAESQGLIEIYTEEDVTRAEHNTGIFKAAFDAHAAEMAKTEAPPV